VSQGRRMRRGARHRVDWGDVLRTALVCDLSQEEIVKMSPAERRVAREAEERRRAAPGYRRWSDESSAIARTWDQLVRGVPGARFVDWFTYLESVGRLDLGEHISKEDGYYCGRCHRDHPQPFYIPGERLWLCRECAYAAGEAQSGARRLEWPKAKN
jgi:hypothetical protein